MTTLYEKLMATGLSYAELSKNYGLPRGALSQLKNGKSITTRTRLKVEHVIKYKKPHPVVAMNPKTHVWCYRVHKIVTKEDSHRLRLRRTDDSF